MVVKPTGLPAHARSSGIETFGGHTDKKNRYNIGVANPKTDQSAEQFSRMVDILRAAEKTMPFAVMSFTNNDSSTSDPTINEYQAMYGGEPTVTRISDGYVSVEFASSYTDSYGVEESFAIKHFTAESHGLEAHIAKCVKSDAQTILIKCIDSTDETVVADLDVILRVW